jgi:hypothetical protein
MLHQEPLIKSLAELTNERDMLLAECKELLEKKTELESMLSGILNSNSWKITKPLRAVMGSWKNLI